MMNAKRSSKVTLTRYAFLIPAVIALLLVFSISKAALIGKNHNLNKALTAKIKSVAAIAESNISPLKNKISNKAKASGKVTDTIRKGNFFISTSHHSDSLNYVINGVKGTKADFQALDSNRIYSMEIMPADRASKIYDQIDNKNNVLFVTTDDSESGKKFKEKIDEVNGIAYIKSDINGNGAVSINTSSGDGTSNGAGVSNSKGSSELVYAAVSPRVKVMRLKIRPKTTATIIADSLIITQKGEPVIEQFEGNDSTKVYSMRVWKNKSYRISPKYKTMIFEPKKAYAYAPKAYTLYSNFNHETNIDHLSQKMIMINGKEATERDLKKLSAADIESMSVKSGDEITKKYGDKAKNGVVFISTKKL